MRIRLYAFDPCYPLLGELKADLTDPDGATAAAAGGQTVMKAVSGMNLGELAAYVCSYLEENGIHGGSHRGCIYNFRI